NWKLLTSAIRPLQAMCDTQRVLADHFLTWPARSPRRSPPTFSRGADSQRGIAAQRRATAGGVLQAFCTPCPTLVNRTFEDALRTVSAYEFARVEFDAHRGDLDALSVRPSHGRTGAEVAKARSSNGNTKFGSRNSNNYGMTFELKCSSWMRTRSE
uniref:AH domain-containing protein n=1 Tax=Macrostomum lignano TaxID=282301 RepID=A0A1I8F5R7_9PLAT